MWGGGESGRSRGIFVKMVFQRLSDCNNIILILSDNLALTRFLDIEMAFHSSMLLMLRKKITFIFSYHTYYYFLFPFAPPTPFATLSLILYLSLSPSSHPFLLPLALTQFLSKCYFHLSPSLFPPLSPPPPLSPSLSLCLSLCLSLSLSLSFSLSLCLCLFPFPITIPTNLCQPQSRIYRRRRSPNCSRN